MPQIRVLPGDLVNQIAAGEVVERPASVVKELVENALDAGASRIHVSIAEGGMRWISVVDDGSGMSREDARLAFERHATSKLATAEDLAAVQTLGFRGEALPSIASVARVRLRTRREADELGTELEGDGAGIARVRDVACPAGTAIEVIELFGQVPARRKFLKSATTESGHVVRWLERMALVRSDVRFELERDGRPLLLFPPTAAWRERVSAVLAPKAAERLLEVEGEVPGARVFGFASPTDVVRGTTADIHLFVNARPVRDRLLLHAVRSAYRDALPPGRHPVAVLFLQVDPGEVDVNVHPAKQEVRFRDPGTVTTLVRRSLAQALGLGERSASPQPARGAWREGYRGEAAGSAAAGGFEMAGGFFTREAAEDGSASPTFAPSSAPPFVFRDLRYVGQVMAGYLLFERPGQLVALDQHAAHERVLFERLRRSLLDDKLEGQALLLPQWIELPPADADALQQASADLARAGFELEAGDTSLSGGVRIGVRSVPAVLASRTGTDFALLLEETAAMLRDPAASETRSGLEQALHGILATSACHSATRKGDRLDAKEVAALLEALDDTIWFPNCPHGRPFVSVLDEADLERRFLRR